MSQTRSLRILSLICLFAACALPCACRSPNQETERIPEEETPTKQVPDTVYIRLPSHTCNSGEQAEVAFLEQHPIDPGVVQVLQGDYWDTSPGLRTTYLPSEVVSRRFPGPVRREVNKDGTIWYSKTVSEDGLAEIGYAHLGRLATGHHVLMTMEMTGGSGIFYSLLFITLSQIEPLSSSESSKAQGVARPKATYAGWYPLGDRFDGQVQVHQDRVRISGYDLMHDKVEVELRVTTR